MFSDKEFLFAMKETVGKTHKSLSNVDGYAAISTVGYRAKRVKDQEAITQLAG
jgi:hypothetical protein